MMLMMKAYGMLDNLLGLDMHRRYKGAGGELVNKKFNYRDVLGNNLNYRHQFDDNKNRNHSPISVDKTWYIKYCTD